MKKIKLILLFFFATFIYGCQNDDQTVEIGNYTNDFQVQKLNFSELKSKAPKIFDKVKNINDLQNSSQFTRNQDINNEFYVDTDEIIEITGPENTSYTFPLFRYYDSDTIRNLVLTVKENNLYSAKVLTYNISEAEKQLILNNVIVDISSKTNVSTLQTPKQFTILYLAKIQMIAIL